MIRLRRDRDRGYSSSGQDANCLDAERGAVSVTVSAEWDALHVHSALLTLIHMNNWGGRWGRLWVRGSCWIVVQHLNQIRDSLLELVSRFLWPFGKYECSHTILIYHFQRMLKKWVRQWTLWPSHTRWCSFKVKAVIMCMKWNGCGSC